MIPRVAAEGLAEWCDVFCEHGVFTPAEATTVLEAGVRVGLKPRIHADELASSGGCEVAARVGARSADHLIYADERCAATLRAANTCAVLLPTAAFYLKLGRFAPARMLIDQGVPVALASDVNPGGGFSPSMPFAMSLACFSMNMTLEEALIAGTLNAAWSLDRAHVVGSLEEGKLMDAVVVAGGLTDLVRVGAGTIRTVIKRGTVRRRDESMTSYSTYALADLFDAFASNDPVPGGGSAAALTGALGVSLLIMVAGLPKTRTGAPEEAADLSRASARLRPLRESLQELIDRDAAAYQAVVAAYRLPKSSNDEQAQRAQAIADAMRAATETPLDTMRLCQQALEGAAIVAVNGLATATSDVAVAIELLLTAAKGAGMNVDANLPAWKDRVRAEQVRLERKELEAESVAAAQRARKSLMT
jgi:formiminotetrahydrofolate cyclodeaminase